MFVQNLKIVLVVLGTLGLYTWVANAIPQVQSEVPAELSLGADVTPAELVSAGEELFAGAGACNTCHGLEDRAPDLLADYQGEGPIGRRCATRVEGEDCKTYLHRSLVEPAAYLVEPFAPIMPDQSIYLSDNQIWALVAYLQDQGGAVTVSAADLGSSGAGEAGGPAPAAAGAAAGPASEATDPGRLMQDNLCFGCHTLGDQGVQVGPPLDGIGSRLDPEEIRRSILEPNAEIAEGYEALAGAMPPTFGNMLTAGQLETLVRFLASQR
ncbi:MAG: c-type cytochrome [Longimicrobiales bacterium]|nr:c-type cytochrome [Longimicrobiales bacterium]